MPANETLFTLDEELLSTQHESKEYYTDLIIDSEKILYNLETIKRRLPCGTNIMAIIKASAYGTDDITLAKMLDDGAVSMFGVAHVHEGILLRQSGIESPIFVMHAPLFEASNVVRWNFDVAVDSLSMIETLAAEACLTNTTVNLHLHVDTGMNRFGCRPEEALDLARKIGSCGNLSLKGIMSHFHSADSPSADELSYNQVKLFDQVIDMLAMEGFKIPLQHLANSSGALRFDLPQYNMVRIGLALYGVHSSTSLRDESPLKLALKLRSHITHIKTCLAGENVSYSGQYTVQRPLEKIATVPIGYHDGIHRCYGGRAYCYVRGSKVKIVGNICMDFLMIDVTDIGDVSVGDEVVFFGEDAGENLSTPEEFAGYGGSIPHELISCLGSRIKRIWR